VAQQRLTAQQERELVMATEGGDADASRKLVEAFLPGIASLALRVYGGVGVERQELVHEGVAGLLVAARRYDTGRSTPFWAYASFWVRKAMQELVADVTRPVALSDRAVRQLGQIRRARRDHLQAYGAEPTARDLSDATGLTPAQVERLQATERTPRGLAEQVSADGGTGATVGELIVDPAAEQAYEEVLDHIEVGAVRDVADRLDGRERAVVRAHYGLGQPPETLTQIGGELGLTAERARQIEVGALEKLREALAERVSLGS
jgi:RNA polymerase primary sigma factor